jgi:hypothetical protein
MLATLPFAPNAGPRAGRAAATALLLAVVIAHADALRGAFHVDDWHAMVREASLQSVTVWLRSQPGIRPLLALGSALSHEGGWEVVAFHAVNLAIHAIDAWLVWRVVRRLAPAAGIGMPQRPARTVQAETAQGVALVLDRGLNRAAVNLQLIRAGISPAQP